MGQTAGITALRLARALPVDLLFHFHVREVDVLVRVGDVDFGAAEAA
jgi:hypothetical protein